MSRNRETVEVQIPAMLAVGQRPDVLIWRQQAGLFRAYDNPRRVVRVGIPGASDAMAIVAVTITPDMVGQTLGVAVAPEFKTTDGRQRAAQRDYQRAVEQRGGLYVVCRSPDDLTQAIEHLQHNGQRAVP